MSLLGPGRDAFHQAPGSKVQALRPDLGWSNGRPHTPRRRRPLRRDPGATKFVPRASDTRPAKAPVSRLLAPASVLGCYLLVPYKASRARRKQERTGDWRSPSEATGGDRPSDPRGWLRAEVATSLSLRTAHDTCDCRGRLPVIAPVRLLHLSLLANI